jgi:hypothetical protein
LQFVLAAKILTVDFVVCTLAVKKNQGRFRHVGSDHSLVSLNSPQETEKKTGGWTKIHNEEHYTVT